VRISAFVSRLRAFIKHDGGNIAGTFAVSFLPLLAMVGAAVDYGQLTSTRSAMKQAADSTALSLVNSVLTSTAAQLQTQGANTFIANMATQLSDLTVTSTYNNTASEITVTATGSVDMSVMKVFNMASMSTTVTSKVTFGSGRLRIALALDTTGSMDDDGKMEAMKAATKSLLDKLKAAGTASGDVYVSIVPFSKDVNVGKSNYNASWIDWSDWKKSNGSCRDGNNYKYYSTKSSCENNGYDWTSDSKSTWNGCVTDRDQDYDIKSTAPVASNTDTLFPAEQYSSCSPAIKGLSTDFTGMKALVDGMYPAGNTNQAIGFAWAWQSLVGGGPFTVPAKDPNYTYQDIIILLSDGLNTEDRWYTNAASINARQKKACDNAKLAGFTIYTVQVNTGGDDDSDVLAYCASDNGKFSILTAADQIMTTFNAIGAGLNKVRISQ
jgi:Flp pilus assembly protein TadG